MLLPVTLATAAACGLISLWLAFTTVRGRMATKTMMGDGGHEDMIVRMRSHANFVEYAPFVLILIALIELARGPVLALWVIAALFVLGRVMHPLGMGRASPNPLRAGGTTLTWLTLLVLSVWALVIAYQAGTAPVARIGDPVETVVPAG